jgi:hypothetical protein
VCVCVLLRVCSAFKKGTCCICNEAKPLKYRHYDGPYAESKTKKEANMCRLCYDRQKAGKGNLCSKPCGACGHLLKHVCLHCSTTD